MRRIKIFKLNKYTAKSLKLLYRASEYNFKVEAFHKLCDGIPHTIVVIKTEYNKIIGAFTPIPWRSVRGGNKAQENSNSSFLFSLTNKDKLILTNHFDQTVRHHSYYGPIFGNGADLFICDKANTN